MENNFDNFFKNKLEHRKFEMKPEFWEGAEALIEADEKSGNRRGFFVWFRFASFAGLSIFFVWGIVNSNQLVATEKKIDTLTGIVKNLKSESDEFEIDISKDNISRENISDDKISFNALNDNEGTIKNNTNISNTIAINRGSGVALKIVSAKSLINKLNESSSSNQFKNDNITAFILGENFFSNQSKLETDLYSEKNELFFINKKQTLASKNKNMKRAKVNIIQPFASISSILMPSKGFFSTKNTTILCLDLEPICSFVPLRNKFAFGIFGGVVGYPLIENSSDNPFVGFKTGFFVERNFEIRKSQLAFGAELTYHYRSGNFVATKQNDVTSYSFGRSITQEKLTPENLHYLELPIFLKYQRSRMTFETGASINYLLGVKGEVTGLDGEVQSGLVPSLGFKNKNVSILLGVHYRISDNIHLGLRANYTRGGILDKGAILPNGIVTALQESKPFYLSFRFTQYLKL
jgi:hypothetical protein